MHKATILAWKGIGKHGTASLHCAYICAPKTLATVWSKREITFFGFYLSPFYLIQ